MKSLTVQGEMVNWGHWYSRSMFTWNWFRWIEVDSMIWNAINRHSIGFEVMDRIQWIGIRISVIESSTIMIGLTQWWLYFNWKPFDNIEIIRYESKRLAVSVSLAAINKPSSCLIELLLRFNHHQMAVIRKSTIMCNTFPLFAMIHNSF